MATGNPSRHTAASDATEAKPGSVWDRAFSPETRRQLIEEDIVAGRTVGIELFSIVLGGLLLMIFALLIGT